MKTLQILIITVLMLTIFVSSNTVFAQISPTLGLPHAFFKTDNAVYPIQYNLTNGRLVANLVDLPARELIFRFNATGDGQLTVELPRDIIDSARDGREKPYLVFVDDMYSGTKRAKADEIQTTNASRTLKIDFTKKDNEIGIVGTYFIENNSTAKIHNGYGAWSPLQQYEKGFDAQDIVCKQDLQLVIKSEDGSPACVKLSSINKLVSLHWALKPVNELTIEEFKDTYKVGEKIDFAFKFKGLFVCGYPSFIVTNTENKTIWESPIVLTLCDSDTGYGESKWKFGDLYSLSINQTGSYKMNMSFSDKTVEKEFFIIQ